ncbi:MAG: Asp23/Gls24 family envelope stress response protein [Solirubrobacteraceae bacterium]
MALDREQEANDTLLACGMPLGRLIDQIAQQSAPEDPEHVTGCPYCQTALARLRSTWEQLLGFAREPIAVPPKLSERIASQLRGLQGGYEGELVLDGRRGRTQVSGRALGTLASLAALSVPGVALASVRRVELDLARAGTVRIDLRLVIELGPSVEALTTRVRGAVGRRLSGGAGASAVTVDIEIADVLA